MPASAERTAVAWLQTLPAVVTAGANVATRLPPDPESKFPFVVVQEIGGGDTLVQPVDKPYIQIDVYDDDRGVADDLALAIVAGFKTRDMVAVVAEGATVMRVEWVAKRAVPEPGTGWERFAIDSLWTIRED